VKKLVADLSLDNGIVMDALREFSEMGRLEFVGSAKYHPIPPLIPQDEMLRQRRIVKPTGATPASPILPWDSSAGDVLQLQSR
jgi:Glycosyl hydrolase family 57